MFARNRDQSEKNVGEGAYRKILSYSDHLMVCEIRLQKGSVTPIHTHPHEQSTYVVSGCCMGIIGKKQQMLEPGDTMLSKENEPHGLTALEDSVILDIFTPVRAEFL